MDYKTEYSRWINNPDLDAELRAELENADDISDRFYRDLEFGTGGLRGVIGAGSNRMNIYTIRKATQGLADYLNGTSLPKSVAIGYDSRIKSDVFALEAAKVLSANNITVYLYPRLEPTPAISYAVRYFKCGAGICVTASHNPSIYNGYKVYGADGCQITLEVANRILSCIDKVDCFKVKTDEQKTNVNMIDEDCINSFVDDVCNLSVCKSDALKDLSIVYTPLNGSGLECVLKMLEKLEVKNVTVVEEQRNPDGNFPTCPYPNPEIKEAMQKGLELCEKLHPDLLLGTDPDCDRVGTAVPDKNGDYKLISGNEMGVILLDFICKMRINNNTMPKNPVAVSTIVSTDMAAKVAEKYGVEFRRVLTGFKFIGEQIGFLEADGEKERFIFGFEESYGYLSGTHSRDKDAVNASLLICEAVAYYKSQGKTLLDVLDELYKEYGYSKNHLLSYTFTGESGMNTMQGIMNTLRENPPKTMFEYAVVNFVDYNADGTGLPKSNVLEFGLENGAKFIVRPSGTEPKIKVYLSAAEKTVEGSNAVIEALSNVANDIMKV